MQKRDGLILRIIHSPSKRFKRTYRKSSERTPNTGGITQPHIPSRGKDGRRYGSEDDGSVAPQRALKRHRTPDQKTTPLQTEAEPTKPDTSTLTPKATTPTPTSSSTPKNRGPNDYGSKEGEYDTTGKSKSKNFCSSSRTSKN